VGEDALVIDERSQALGDLAILRVEELPKHGGDRLLLAGDVGSELAVDVVDESLPDVLQARLLGLRIRVGQGAQLCVPKTSSVLIARPNRLNVSGDDRAALLLPDPVRLAVQVKEPT
jgi:hypothetical protein